LLHGNPTVECVWITRFCCKSKRILHLCLKVLFPIILMIKGLPVDLRGERSRNPAVSVPLRSFMAP
jgi:hypothetical protein